MRRVWRVPWRTHNNMLPHLAGLIDPELWFAKRCIKCINEFLCTYYVHINFLPMFFFF